MVTIEQARDAIAGHLLAGWIADSVLVAAIPATPERIKWDDVEGNKPGHDAAGRPQSFARITIRHTDSTTETLFGGGAGKDQHTGVVVVQVFTPHGEGRQTSDRLAQRVKVIMQRKRIPGVDGWFLPVRVDEIGGPGPWAQVNVSAGFVYSETVAGGL